MCACVRAFINSRVIHSCGGHHSEYKERIQDSIVNIKALTGYYNKDMFN